MFVQKNARLTDNMARTPIFSVKVPVYSEAFVHKVR